jgi:hypothetical protein
MKTKTVINVACFVGIAALILSTQSNARAAQQRADDARRLADDAQRRADEARRRAGL